MDLENIQIPFPSEEDTQVLTQTLTDNLNDAMSTTTKSGDIYGGLSLEYMVTTWGKDKTIEYLETTADLYKAMGMKEESSNLEKTSQKLRYSDFKSNMDTIRQQKYKNAKTALDEINKELTLDTKRAVSKADNINKQLSDFSASRRRDIQSLIAAIDAIPTKAQLESFIVQQLGGIAFSTISKKIEEKTKPLTEDILPWLEAINVVYEAGKNLSMDNIINIVSRLITLQYYPFITKYKQYNNTLKELRNLTLELNLIVAAINNKAESLGMPLNVTAPTIPTFPTLPELPI